MMVANAHSAHAKHGAKTTRMIKPMQVSLYEAKTSLSSLVERASKGEEIVIAKAGKPMARLTHIASSTRASRMPGKNALGITYIADDFDAPLPEEVLKDFGI